MANIIIVSVQYRLGIFSFHYSTGNILDENLDVFDQRNSLYLIHDNLDVIGIDPSKIIIGGHDHGAEVKVTRKKLQK
jgi:carboxylesterase type B